MKSLRVWQSRDAQQLLHVPSDTQLRQLTADFTLPEWACHTYRALFEALATFEQDRPQHMHQENNVLFPQAVLLAQPKVG